MTVWKYRKKACQTARAAGHPSQTIRAQRRVSSRCMSHVGTVMKSWVTVGMRRLPNAAGRAREESLECRWCRAVVEKMLHFCNAPETGEALGEWPRWANGRRKRVWYFKKWRLVSRRKSCQTKHSTPGLLGASVNSCRFIGLSL